MTLVNWAVSHASLSWTHSSAKTKYDLFLNEITLSGWADVACRNTVHELPVGLTSLYIRIPKTPRTEPGKNVLHYCQREVSVRPTVGECRALQNFFIEVHLISLNGADIPSRSKITL